MADETWNQDLFNRTLDSYLKHVGEDKVPHALNKKAFFVALRAIQETPKVGAFGIIWELTQPILARREDGSTGSAPIGYVIAAKRASAHWGDTSETARERNRGRKRKQKAWAQKAWRQAVDKKFRAMVGGRKAAIGFLRVGWLAAVRKLGSTLKDRSGAPAEDATIRRHGDWKGDATPAKASMQPVATISNSAQARSDKRYGLGTIGGPALQRAFDAETADMNEYLEREALKEEGDKFNADNR
jgi:hypothetical protein